MDIPFVTTIEGDSACAFVPSIEWLDLGWCKDTFDKDGPKSLSDKITLMYLGDIQYMAGKTHVERVAYEIATLRDAGCLAWNGFSKNRKPYWQHLAALIRLLWPDTDLTPTTVDAIRGFCWGFGNGRKVLNLIGSQNSSKSSILARIAFACIVIDPAYSSVYVSNPFDTAASSTVWGDISTLWESLCEVFPSDDGGCQLFPNGNLLANKELILIKSPKTGKLVVRNVKSDGNFRGIKARKPGRGTIILIIDEVNMIPRPEFLTVIQNLASQPTLFIITSQNFTDLENMGAKLTTPVSYFGGPGLFKSLDIDKSFAWDSAYSSLTLRFDGHKSLNVILSEKSGDKVTDRIVYPYLLKTSDVKRVALSGLGSPDYLSQIRSFPAGADEEDSLLSPQRIKISQYDDTFFAFTEPEKLKRFLFVDPAFGGKDKAMAAIGVMGPARVVEGGGRTSIRHILNFPVPFVEIEVFRDILWTDQWYSKCRQLGVEPSSPIGKNILPEEQVAIETMLLANSERIPLNHVGYDFSLRDELVIAMSRYSNAQARSFNYLVTPLNYQLYAVGGDTSIAANRVSELALLTSDILACRQIRGGENIENALIELSRTLVVKRAPRIQIELKKEYKSRNEGYSPDARDALMGVVGMAVMNGFIRGTQSTLVQNGQKPRSGRLDLLYSGFSMPKPKRL